MGMIQRVAFVGRDIKAAEGQNVRLTLCFIHKNVNKDKKSTLSVMIKDTKYGKLLKEDSFDVTGNVSMEEGSPKDFRAAAIDLIKEHYRNIVLHLPEENKDFTEPVDDTVIG